MYRAKLALIKFLSKNYKGLISTEEQRTLFKNSNYRYASTEDPFHLQKSKNRYFNLVLKMYLIKKNLPLFIMTIVGLLEIALIIYDLLRLFSKRSVWEFEINKIDINRSYRVITLTKGIERAKSPLFRGISKLDVPVVQVKRRCSHYLIEICNCMIRYRFYSVPHLTQFIILKSSRPALQYKYLILEEGGDYISNIFYFLYATDAKKTILSHRAPYISGFIKNDFSVNIVFDDFSFRESILAGNKTIKRKIPTRLKNTERKSPRILYFTTPEFELFSQKLKNSVDKKIFDMLKRSGFNYSVSFHPQDINRGYKNIATKDLGCDASKIRVENTIEEYVSDGDVVITYWSGIISEVSNKDCKIILLTIDFPDIEQFIKEIFGKQNITTLKLEELELLSDKLKENLLRTA
jgi:hypothetical protein